MLHEIDEVLKVARTLAEKVIEFSNHCKNDEFKDENIRCYELSLIADMARQVTVDLSEDEKS
jgi:hypothetical protein